MAGRVKVELDRAHLAARMKKGREHCGPFLAEQIKGDSIPYTPNDGEGTLQSSGRVEKIGDDYAVTYNTVYAAYQWYGCWPDGTHSIKHHTLMPNALATTQWIEAAKKAKGKDWETVAQREYVKGAGG